MNTPKDDIFYLDIEHKDWDILGKHFICHEFPNSQKIINGYINFY
jgi:hypothetical protein